MNKPALPTHRHRGAAAITLLLLLGPAAALRAQTQRSYVNTSTTGVWSNAASWQNGAPVNGDSLLFDRGNVNPQAANASTDDIASLSITSLYYKSTSNGTNGAVTSLNPGVTLTLTGSGIKDTEQFGETFQLDGGTSPTSGAGHVVFNSGASAGTSDSTSPTNYRVFAASGGTASGGRFISYPAASMTFNTGSAAGNASFQIVAGTPVNASGIYYATAGGSVKLSGTASGGTGSYEVDGYGETLGGSKLYASASLDLSAVTSGAVSIGSLIGGGRVLLGANALTLGGANTSTSFTGIVSGAGGSLVKTGSGTFTLSTADYNAGGNSGQNTYSGGTVVNAGTLKAGGGGNVFGTGTLTVNAGTLDLNGNGVSVGGLAGTGGTVVDNGAAAALTVNGGSGTCAGTLADGSGALTLTVSGGTTTLSGTNTFTGGINLNGGVLSVSTDTNLGNSSGAINFNGGTLQITGDSLSGFNNHPINASTFNGGIDVEGNSFTIDQTLSGSGGLTKLGPGSLSLTTSNSFTGATNVNAGILILGSPGALGGSAAINVAQGASLSLDNGSLGALFVQPGQTLTNNGYFRGQVYIDGTVAGSGLFYNRVTVENGGTLSGAVLIGDLLTVNNGGTVSVSGGTLTAGGGVLNNGTMRFEDGASLSVSSGQTFTNNGVLDIITGSYSAPSGLTNNGVIYDSSVIRARSASLSGGVFTVTVDGYTGHTYQLQSTTDLANVGFANLGSPQTGSTGSTLTFTDASPAAGQGFYRVQVDQ